MAVVKQADIPSFFLNPAHSDIRLRVREGDECKEFPAHAFVLKMKSKVFRILIDNQKFDEEGPPPVSDLAIQGGVAVALAFVKYMYTGHTAVENFQDNLHLLKAAYDYQTDQLLELTENAILSGLRPDNVSTVYNYIKGFASPEIRNRCLDLMTRCAFLLFRERIHLTWDETAFKSVLGSNSLNVVSEDHAFEALWQWGTWQCFQIKKRITFPSVKGFILDLFPLIRWNDIRGTLGRELSDRIDKCKPKEYETSSRTPTAYPSLLEFAIKLQLIENNARVAPRCIGFNTPEKLGIDMLSFMVNQDVLIAGVELHLYMEGSIHENIDAHVDFYLNDYSLIAKGSRERFLNFEHWYGRDYTSSSITIEFIKPCLLEKLKTHRFRLIKKCGYRQLSYPIYRLNNNTVDFECIVGGESAKMFITDQIACLTTLYLFSA